MNPMLATLWKEPFSDPDWIYERKLDGQRCLVFKKDGDVSLFSRNQNPQNESFPELVEALSRCSDKDFIADGEIVVMKEGVSDFSSLQPRLQAKGPDPSVPVRLYLFDLMHFDGQDLTSRAVRERKKWLKANLSFEAPLFYTPHRNENGLEYLEEAGDKGWEGLIAKEASSEYHHSRSKKWLKFKCLNQQEFVIGGFTEPQGERRGFGALLIGYYEDDRLLYAGKVGTGYDGKFLDRFRETLRELETDKAPFEDLEEADPHTHWVKPEKVAQVSFTEWTAHHKLRHPSFLGLRTDKEPREVAKEKARA